METLSDKIITAFVENNVFLLKDVKEFIWELKSDTRMGLENWQRLRLDKLAGDKLI